ncbi:MAG: hypothetical protein JWL72_4429 [Ilumatobacteraceae bacterium]|nr:hypothetical protein [Ilumatobacteraceae bacterium]
MTAQKGLATQDQPSPDDSPTTASTSESNGTAERQLWVTTSAKPTTNAPWKGRRMTVPQFWDWMDLEHPATQKECGGYVLGELNSSHRARKYLTVRSVLTLDADEATPTFLADVDRVLAGLDAGVHTTYRHGVEGNRYRVLVPLSRDVDGDTYERLHESVRSALGEHWSAKDNGCPEPERFMYRPSFNPDSVLPYFSRRSEGDLLDVDAWLSAGPSRPSIEPPPKPSAVRATSEGVHPAARKEIAGELARLLDCTLGGWDEAWDDTTFKVACNLYQLSNSPWAGYSEQQAEADLMDHAPADADFGRKKHAEKWASAKQCVGDKSRPEPIGATDDFGRKLIDVSNMDDATEWLRREVGWERTPLAGLFLRDGKLMCTPRIGEDGYVPPDDNHSDDGPAQVRRLTDAQLRAMVDSRYGFYKVRGKDRTMERAVFPADAATLVYNDVGSAPNLRRLAGVTHTPMLRRDGTVLSAEGYDEDSGWLYLPDAGMMPVPDLPTTQEVQSARALIDQMLEEFPFVTEHDRANYLALLFTPLLRVVVPPPYPLGLIHAHQPGSGKSYLARILRTLHGGALRPLPGTEEEFRKQITSILTTTTAPVVLFDNVHKLQSAALDALLTSETWSDRRLGRTGDAVATNDRLWLATGNNVTIGGDLLRRLLWINIDPKRPNPELRTDFAIPNLPGWVRQRRGELLAALLTVLRAWVLAEQPRGPVVRSDDYADWTRATQGILMVGGWLGTVGDVETVQKDSNDEETEWATFLAAVWDKFGGEPWTVRQMLDSVSSEFADENVLPADMNPNSTRSAGMWLKNRKGRWAGGYVLNPAPKTSDSTAQWKVGMG